MVKTPDLTAEKAPTQTKHPIAIVILGTLTHDQSALSLANYLNGLGDSVEVFYYPENDASEPFNIPVTLDNLRIVNPLRVPEDLRVVDLPDAKSEQDYYAAVGKLLQSQGREAFAIMVPQAGKFEPTIQRNVKGDYNDYEYIAEPNSSKQIHVRVPFREGHAFLQAAHYLTMIGAANIMAIAALRGAPVSYKSCELASVRTALIDELHRVGFRAQGTNYIEKLTEFLINKAIKLSKDSTVAGISEYGIPYTLSTNVADLNTTVQATLQKMINEPSLIEDANETAKRILDKAYEKAKSDLAAAQDEVAELKQSTQKQIADDLAEARRQAEEIIADAREESEDIELAALEVANLSGELPQILRPIIAAQINRAGQQISEQQQRELADLAFLRGEIKKYCDAVHEALYGDKSANTFEFTKWGNYWETGEHKNNREKFNALMSTFVDGRFSIPRVEAIHKAVNDTITGIKTTSIENAVLAVAVAHMLDKFPETSAAKSALEHEVDKVYWRTDVEWNLEQSEVDAALHHAIFSYVADRRKQLDLVGLAHPGVDLGYDRSHIISESDYLFIEACDRKLGGAITASLERSVGHQELAAIQGELESLSAGELQFHRDARSLLDQIEISVHDAQVVNQDVHARADVASGNNLAAIMQRVEEAAHQQTSAQVPVVQTLAQPAQGSGQGAVGR